MEETLHQLIGSLSPNNARVSYIPSGAGFLNHQQYKSWNNCFFSPTNKNDHQKFPVLKMRYQAFWGHFAEWVFPYIIGLTYSLYGWVPPFLALVPEMLGEIEWKELQVQHLHRHNIGHRDISLENVGSPLRVGAMVAWGCHEKCPKRPSHFNYPP